MDNYEYLYTEYGYSKEAVKYIKSVDDIIPYFEEDYISYFDCGQGYYEDSTKVLVFVDGTSYIVSLVGEMSSAKQDRGDRLYWIETLVSVDLKEVGTPSPKQRYNCVFSKNNLTQDEIDSLLDKGFDISVQDKV